MLVHDLLQEFDGVRFLPDIHGEAGMLAEAVQGAIDQNLLVVSLGDLINYGPDSASCMEICIHAVREGAMRVIPGNHDIRFLRFIQGHCAGIRAETLGKTLKQLAGRPNGTWIADQYAQLIASSPLWMNIGRYRAAHGAFDTCMQHIRPPTAQERILSPWAKRVVHGESSGRARHSYTQTYGWVQRVPRSIRMIVGHDPRHTHPLSVSNPHGGHVVFLDTGCGKGGTLSMLDVRARELGPDTPATPRPLLTLVVAPPHVRVEEHHLVLQLSRMTEGLDALVSTVQSRLAQGSRATVVLDTDVDLSRLAALVPDHHPVQHVLHACPPELAGMVQRIHDKVDPSWIRDMSAEHENTVIPR